MKIFRFDQQYEVFLGDFSEIKTCRATTDFLSKSFHDVVIITKSASNILNNAFKVFWGEPGVPADLYGLYYIANRLAKVYVEMVTWSIKIKSTTVPEYFELAKSLSSEFNKIICDNIWAFPEKIQKTLDEVLLMDARGENNPIQSTLDFNTDPNVINAYLEEMKRLTIFFGNHPDLYD